MQQLSKQPAFELGQIVATPGALAAFKKSGQQPGEFLTRHVNREWGNLTDEDRKEKDYSIGHSCRSQPSGHVVAPSGRASSRSCHSHSVGGSSRYVCHPFIHIFPWEFL